MIYFFIGISLLFITFWIAQVLFVKSHLKWSKTIIESDGSDKEVSVSVIHPVKDLDFEYEKNLDSWINQNYRGAVQHIFSFQEPEDPAIKVVEKIKGKYPDAEIEITVNPITKGINGKSSNMVNGLKLAKYDYVVFGDSDIRVERDFLVKMVQPLRDEAVGITTCGQINIGGKNFWTRFFTFVQNSETDFIWAFLTRLGIDVGITGAAFGMRKALLIELGGLESYGVSLLEDMHLGNTLYKLGYKIVLGPFIECHVDKLEREKSFNYAKRIATGVRAHIALELPAFIIMLFWYWIMLALALITNNKPALYYSLGLLVLRVIHGMLQRVVSMNKISIHDFYTPLIFDLFGTFYLLFSFRTPKIMWRGIEYDVKKGGYINPESEILEEKTQEQ
ncbi:MAG: glycosyltransferase [Eubacteriales bacterium]|nr:glycosyltransferase [Eubacteriales bacterium]